VAAIGTDPRTRANWQPDWSPDGKNLVYRSEDGDGGLFVVPAFGGDGRERRIASFGYHPRWSPDSSQVLFQTHFMPLGFSDKFYVVRLDGTPPREVLADFIAANKLYPISTAWHPDGKRLSISIFSSNPGSVVFWTVPTAGGTAIKTEIDPTIEKQVEVSTGPQFPFAAALSEGAAEDFQLPWVSFSWSPSGNAIYFERLFRGTINIWKMTIDPRSLQATALDRLSTGPGPDVRVAISHDGKRLAFTAKSQHRRTRLFPFDASTRRLSGEGQPITAAGRAAAYPVLSRDGNRLAFSTPLDNGRWELWQKSLVDGREGPVITDDYSRIPGRWSFDGTQLAYNRSNNNENKSELMVWSRKSRSEEPLTSTSSDSGTIYDWSPDGKWLLCRKRQHSRGIWMLPLLPHPTRKRRAKIASDPKYDLWHNFSPNGRWIAFEAVTNLPTSLESSIYVVPVEGGTWNSITKGKPWDDKPRWSPDGKTIYYISDVGGFFNLWGIHFDPSTGQPVGEPFQLSAFKRPSLMIPQRINLVSLSLSQDKLVLTVEEVSGGIWMLDNVDQ
jgi:Tol biopolymer transport system component